MTQNQAILDGELALVGPSAVTFQLSAVQSLVIVLSFVVQAVDLFGHLLFLISKLPRLVRSCCVEIIVSKRGGLELTEELFLRAIIFSRLLGNDIILGLVVGLAKLIHVAIDLLMNILLQLRVVKKMNGLLRIR